LKFKLACESSGIVIGSRQLERFVTYQKELSRWNKKINLISRSSDSPEQIFRHILDSLLIFKAVALPTGAEILDYGMLKTLNLKKAEVVRGRAEDLTGSFEFSRRYDVVTAKAVGKLVDVTSLALPFLKTGGLLVAYKGKYSKEETDELSTPGKFQVYEVASFEISEYSLTRSLVVIKRMQ